jgi:hypothetical protein
VASLLALALTAAHWADRRAFEGAVADPAAAQASLLRRLLRDNAATVFGREHGFATTDGPAAFARRVPIRDYEALRPYVRRLLAGERDVLTAEAPLAFATTSGTTGEPKFVPVTPTTARQTAALMRLWTGFALRDHPTLLDHAVLSLVGPATEGLTPAGCPYGAMTGLTYQQLPWLIRRRHAVPDAVALIGDHDTRYFVAARLALARAVSSLAAPNASAMLRLAETAARRTPALIRAIHDGTLGVSDVEAVPGAGVGSAELRAALERGLRRDRPRAAALAVAAARRGRLVLGECWPELALVACWLGGSAGVQARHLDAEFGPEVARRDLGLAASEGRLTVPVEDRTAAGVLAVHTTFFEFVDEDAVDDPAPRTRLCHELEEGRCYHVILTAANGLYRYDLNDVVEVRGVYRRTPMVAFVRKGRDMLNITGEKLHLNHVLGALKVAEQAAGTEVWQFRLIADAEATRYDLLVELTRPLRSPVALAAAFDRALAGANAEYASKRASSRLRAPRVFVMRPGWAERVCRDEVARGRREAQHKWSALADGWDAVSRAELGEPREPAAGPCVSGG